MAPPPKYLCVLGGLLLKLVMRFAPFALIVANKKAPDYSGASI